MRTAVILGGKGLLGAMVSRLLLDSGWRILSVDSGLFEPCAMWWNNRNCRCYSDHDFDATDALAFRTLCHDQQPIDAIVNLVGPARPEYYRSHPIETLHAHVISTMNAVESAARHSAAYIHASSSEVYGDSDQTALREDAYKPLSPLSIRAAYVEAKRSAEALVFAHSQLCACPAVILRLFNVYGPGAALDDDRVVPNLMKSVAHGAPFVIHGDGEQVRCFSYVLDVAEAFVKCLMALDQHFLCVNIGTPQPISIRSLVEKTSAIQSCKIATIRAPERTGDIRMRIPDVSRARRILNWVPRVDLDAGLRIAIEDALRRFGR